MHRAMLSAVLSLSVLFSPLVAAQDASYTFTTINAPNAIDTVATGINTHGQVVGEYTEDTPLQPTYGFLYDAGVFITLDAPDAFVSQAHGINDRGQIVGFYADSSGTFRGFVATPTAK